MSGPGQRLPHLDTIQTAFGRHDVSDVSAHVGGAAARSTEALDAEAYATGNHVAFRAHPDLHTAAHEAAHIVQQRGGVQLKGGLGAPGDRYEKHADQVADVVVAGQSAQALLDEHAGSPGQGTDAVQAKSASREQASGAETGEAPDVEPGPASVAELTELLHDALAKLDRIEARYHAEFPALIQRAEDGLDALIAATQAPIARLQSFLAQENDFNLLLFQASYSEVLLRSGISTAVGLLSKKHGAILGFAYSAAEGLYLAEKQNALVDSTQAHSNFLAGAASRTTDAVIQEFMQQQGSHARRLGNIEGALQHVFREDGGHVVHAREALTDELRFIESASNVGLHDAGRMAQAALRADELIVTIESYLDELEACASEVAQAAKEAPAVGEAAVDHVLDLYARFRSRGAGLELTGWANRFDIQSRITLEMKSFGTSGARDISAEFRAHLLSRSLREFAHLGIPVRMTLALVPPGVRQETLVLEQDSAGSQRPRRHHSPALAALIGWNPPIGDTARSQLALDMIWTALSTAPLSRRTR